MNALEGGGFAASELLSHQTFNTVSLAPPDEPQRKGTLLEAPELFRYGDATVLFASAYPDGRPEVAQERVVVLVDVSAELPVTPEARVVGPGSDPEPVDLGDSVLLAVRRAAHYGEAVGEAPLVFLRSKDLETWTEEAKFVGTRTRPAYAVASHRGELWMATWSDPADPRVVIRSFDGTRGEWAIAAGIGVHRYRGSPSADGVWLVPNSAPDARRPELRYVRPNGSIARE